MISKEKIEARIVDLEKQLDQLNNNGNALMGALQDCRYWLAQLNQPEQIASLDSKAELAVARK